MLFIYMFIVIPPIWSSIVLKIKLIDCLRTLGLKYVEQLLQNKMLSNRYSN